MDKSADDFRELAQEALEQARTLVGLGSMSDREFLESMARCDRLVDHEDDCGHCAMQIIQAQTARDLLAEGEILDGIHKWSVESRRRWEQSKYFKLYQAEKAAGRDPHKAFEERGWEM
jgi:hypothetical protein